ncbi:MAG: hypothetical protein HC866_21565 [Leptolyngbyaceae cyanobacterium RU_5_1]|nr:hypothetical protein [Leptolyngbyaceae cyanobacterium RU_5_1]
MKTLIYTATVALACLSSVPLALASSSMGSAAYAAEQDCQVTSGSATAGGAIREHLEAIAKCGSMNQRLPETEASLDRGKTVSPSVSTTSMGKSEPSSYPAYCPFLLGGAEPGEFGYHEALYKCRYGS